MTDQPPKIQIDSDWKKQAQEEKERLAAEVEAKGPAGPAGAAAGAAPAAAAAVGPEGLPPASFQELLAMLGTQVFMFLGEIPEPVSGRAVVSPPLAKHYIDLLGVLESKTRGNLTDDEKKQLDQLLYEARMHYVQIASGASQVAVRPPSPGPARKER